MKYCLVVFLASSVYKYLVNRTLRETSPRLMGLNCQKLISINQSIYLSINLSIYLSIYLNLSIYLSIYLFESSPLTCDLRLLMVPSWLEDWNSKLSLNNSSSDRARRSLTSSARCSSNAFSASSRCFSVQSWSTFSASSSLWKRACVRAKPTIQRPLISRM